jgi:hypothetical protein
MSSIIIERLGPDRIIAKKVGFDNCVHQMSINISDENFYIGWHSHLNGMLIQDAFPHLSADEREFLLNGTTPEMWNEIFKGGEEE